MHYIWQQSWTWTWTLQLYLVFLPWACTGQDNQPLPPVLHVVEEAQLARLNQQRLQAGRRQMDQPNLRVTSAAAVDAQHPPVPGQRYLSKHAGRDVLISVYSWSSRKQRLVSRRCVRSHLLGPCLVVHWADLAPTGGQVQAEHPSAAEALQSGVEQDLVCGPLFSAQKRSYWASAAGK